MMKEVLAQVKAREPHQSCADPNSRGGQPAGCALDRPSARHTRTDADRTAPDLLVRATLATHPWSAAPTCGAGHLGYDDGVTGAVLTAGETAAQIAALGPAGVLPAREV